MADLSKQLSCETQSDADFIENQTRRSSRLAAMKPTTSQEIGFHRQKTNLNNIKERAEKILRSISKTRGDDAADETRFVATKKDSTEKNLRGLLAEVKRQEDFYLIAERHGYAVAKRVEKYEVSGALEEGTAKVLVKVLKTGNSSKEARSPQRFPKNPQPYTFSPQPPTFTWPTPLQPLPIPAIH